MTLGPLKQIPSVHNLFREIWVVITHTYNISYKRDGDARMDNINCKETFNKPFYYGCTSPVNSMVEYETLANSGSWEFPTFC